MALENEHDFSGYEPTTKDPGWSLTVIVIVACILINLSLPILVRLAAAFDKRKAEQKDGISAAGGDEPDILEHESEASKPTLKGAQHSKPTGLYQIPYFTPSVVSNGDMSTRSVRSNVSSSVLSQVSSAILDARPHRLGHKRQTRYKKNPPVIPALKPDVANVLQTGTSHLDEVSSVCSKSVMSTLDHDAIDASDAIDARDGNATMGQNEPVLLEQDTPSSLWWQFLEIADWDAESKRLAALTIPYTISGASEGIFSIVNVAVIGHHLGVMEANAYVVVTILLEFTNTITYGFGEGEE
jgi:hypothetical protein